MRNRSTVVRRTRELRAESRTRNDHFEAVFARLRAYEERRGARKPFPREMGVHPHQLIARSIEACEAYGRLLRKEPKWDRHDRRTHARLYRLLFGESLSALGRRLERQRNHWRVTAVHLLPGALAMEGNMP